MERAVCDLSGSKPGSKLTPARRTGGSTPPGEDKATKKFTQTKEVEMTVERIERKFAAGLKAAIADFEKVGAFKCTTIPGAVDNDVWIEGYVSIFPPDIQDCVKERISRDRANLRVLNGISV